jgi:DNA transposition AAA+ family ATPase
MIRPGGLQPLFSKPAESPDGIYQDLAGHMLLHNLQEIEKTLGRKGVRFSLLNNEKLCVNLVSQYMEVKMRQII